MLLLFLLAGDYDRGGCVLLFVVWQSASSSSRGGEFSLFSGVVVCSTGRAVITGCLWPLLILDSLSSFAGEGGEDDDVRDDDDDDDLFSSSSSSSWMVHNMDQYVYLFSK